MASPEPLDWGDPAAANINTTNSNLPPPGPPESQDDDLNQIDPSEHLSWPLAQPDVSRVRGDVVVPPGM